MRQANPSGATSLSLGGIAPFAVSFARETWPSCGKRKSTLIFLLPTGQGSFRSKPVNCGLPHARINAYSMLPDIENLLKLQDTDKGIRRLQDEVAEFPKRVAVIEQKLAGTKAQLEKAQAAVKADEDARRKYDTAIHDLRAKISKYRDHSLDVKTNDQYKALLHEIQFAEKEIAANEDKILEMMVNADARDKVVKAAHAELK